MTLPQGWAETTLGNCQGRTSSVDPRAFPDEVFDLFSVPSYSEYSPTTVAGRDIGSTKQVVQAADVLLCKIVPHIRRGWVVPKAEGRRQIGSGEWIVFRDHGLEPHFLRRFILSDSFHDQFMQTTSGVGGSLTRARPAEAAKIKVPVPPLAEQRRIVAKLDALTARLDRARAELGRLPVLANNMRDTALANAFDGLLTDEGGEPKENWKTVPFAEAGAIASNLVPPATISDLPHIAPNHIQSGRPVLLPYRTVGEDEVISGKHRFYPGQIIYSKIRPNLRKVVLVDFGGGCSADMYPINARCHARYLMYWMLSPQFTWLATRQDGRTLLPKINQNGLNAIATPLAPPLVQERIAAILDQIFARADRLEAEAAHASALLDRLESALLAKAFRGELVPQNPNDEPASVLLERIRVQRAAAPKPKRGRKVKAGTL